MNKNKTLYKLTVEDFQNVALEEIDRELNDAEIEIVKKSVEDNLNWYEIISNSLSQIELASKNKK
ncbi:MAG: hypothetical protein C0417_03045 [Chlorobiaceae bacterium]|nr:hypothetical protein [Chlorobiaceae bacterium]